MAGRVCRDNAGVTRAGRGNVTEWTPNALNTLSRVARRGLEALEQRTRYDPQEVEPRVLARWLEAGYFHPEPGGSAAETYSIATPPPNVTGALLMGHALNAGDHVVLIRSNRCNGRRNTTIVYNDHAGIA